MASGKRAEEAAAVADDTETKTRGRGRFRVLLRFLVDISAIITLLAFLFSIFLHALVFDEWGVNFLQVAAPSDVLMSGISFSYQIGAPILVALFVGGYASLILIGIVESLADQPKLAETGAWRGLARLLSGRWVRRGYDILVVLLIIFIVEVISGTITLTFYPIGGPDEAWTNWPDAVVTIGIGLILLSSYAAYKRKPQPGLSFEGFMTVSLGIAAIILFCQTFIQVQAARGFEARPTFLADAATCGGAGARGRVLWIGSEFTIVRCLGPAALADRILIFHGGDNVLRVAP